MSERPADTDQPEEDPMAWLDDPSKSLVPSVRKKPARPKKPSEDEVRKALKEAPEAPKVKPKRKGKSDGPEQDKADHGRGSAGSRGEGDRGRGEGKDRASGAAPGDGSSGGGGRASSRGRGEIFANCPVTPLGVNGDNYYYLDVIHQLRRVDNHSQEKIRQLFGHQLTLLQRRYPSYAKGSSTPTPGRFDQTRAANDMVAACTEIGLINPDNVLRGVGAWKDDAGRLVYHMGDQVLIGGKVHKPGRIGNRIYPAAPPIPHPAETGKFADPLPELMRVLKTWNWMHPELHPTIALGMIGVLMLCGAMDWRTVFWLLAPPASGKSEFQDLLKYLVGDGGLVQTADATARGITSQLQHSSLPVAIDEMDKDDERSTREMDLIRLARLASSGGKWFRSNANQEGSSGQIMSAFLFSSILIPGGMKPQDVQRLIRLEMHPIKKGTAKLGLAPAEWRERGAALKRILIDRWDSWPARMSIWRHALEAADVGGRDADNWGTVLAMADMATSEALPTEDAAAELARRVAFLAVAGRDETRTDSEALLLHLMGQVLDPYRKGELFTVAQWVQVAACLPGAPTNLLDTAISGEREQNKLANAKIAKYGLRVYGTKDQAKLFIANATIPALNDLFRGTVWHGGAWQQSASRIPGAEPVKDPATINLIRTRGYLIPITAISGAARFPMDRDDQAPPEPAPQQSDGSGAEEWDF